MELLKTIKDGEIPEDDSLMRKREASRAVILDEDKKIPLLFVSKDHYHKLPGGGIESGEDKVKALEREVKEETGSAVHVTGEVGIVLEYRFKYNLKQSSYCYLAKIVSKGKPRFTAKETRHGFRLIWVTIDEAIKMVEEDKPTDYDGSFIQKRDIVFLKKAKQLMQKTRS